MWRLIGTLILLSASPFVWSNETEQTEQTEQTEGGEISAQNSPHFSPQTNRFEEGRDYFSYVEPITELAKADGKILIQFFFDYDCRICSSALDILELYSQINRDKVTLREYPVATAKDPFSANVFFALQGINAEPLSATLLFETAEKQRYGELSRLEDLRQWLQQQGVDDKEFMRQYSSAAVKQKIKQAIEKTEEYGVFTFPYVIINGKYVLTASTLYNDEYSFAVLDFLVNQK